MQKNKKTFFLNLIRLCLEETGMSLIFASTCSGILGIKFTGQKFATYDKTSNILTNNFPKAKYR